MAVNSPFFMAFVFWFYVLFHFCASTRFHKRVAIIAGSLVFYGCSSLPFMFLLLATAIGNYILGYLIFSTIEPRRRSHLTACGVVANLVPLVLFKYSPFFISNSNTLLHFIVPGISIPIPSLTIPLGVSFHTFTFISYIVDIYRGVSRPARGSIEFCASFIFFPTLVAGPIARASEIVPQIEKLQPPDEDCFKWGFYLIASGLLNKAIADLVGRYVDLVFVGAIPYGLVGAWSAALGFATQIFADFSGYTDIVTGVALLFGLILPPNFNLPYLATSPIQFWRRWHISLSTWLRDYLWLPLSLRFPGQPLATILITMMLCGLWHGANWTFVVWGFYNGVLIVVTHWLGNRFPSISGAAPRPKVLVIGQVLVTFYLIVVGRVIYRAATIEMAWKILSTMHSVSTLDIGLARDSAQIGLMLTALVASHLIAYGTHQRAGILRRPALYWALTIGVLAISLAIGGTGESFRYEQF